MKISFVIPSRNNLKYFKWAYQSIQKNKGLHDVYICAADDASTDGTAEHFYELAQSDPKFTYITNEGPERVGHTILYDRIINELVKTEVAIIYHADMYLAPRAIDAIEENLSDRKTIVSLTRIEPPLHPAGPEKCIWDCGQEPEEFDESKLLKFVDRFTNEVETHHKRVVPEMLDNKTTEGIFAPWAFWVEDFKEIGGHDPLFAPQSKEDSDIFNRFQLNGVKFIQTWGGFVYHMTCRGSRYNPTITTVGKESDEWLAHNVRSTRNFIRKWGHFVQHDKYMKPIIPPKYDIGIVLKGGIDLLSRLEPWCNNIYLDDPSDLIIPDYIKKEQPNTKYDLSKRIVQSYYNDKPSNEVLLYIDQKDINSTDLEHITIISSIIEQAYQMYTSDLGNSMQVGNIKMVFNKLPIKDYRRDLIHL